MGFYVIEMPSHKPVSVIHGGIRMASKPEKCHNRYGIRQGQFIWIGEILQFGPDQMCSAEPHADERQSKSCKLVVGVLRKECFQPLKTSVDVVLIQVRKFESQQLPAVHPSLVQTGTSLNHEIISVEGGGAV